MPPTAYLEVVAAAITDPRGRVLLTRRTAGRELAGLWEFPGGKREPDESPEQALARELEEELGIQARIGAPLIAVPQIYPGKRLRLDVRRVDAWKGTPKGHEGQALAWVPPHKLASYAMPPADRPVVAALTHPDRYLVTPAPGPDDGAWLAGIERALATGIRRLHLRLPDIAPDRRARLATRAAALCRAAGADVLVSGDPALARDTGAGLHLRAAQLAALDERLLPPGAGLLAAACHDETELRHAQRLDCDFAVLGPLRPTPTHPDAAGLGWDRFAALRETVSLPIYAIGGLAPDDIDEARRHGAQGIAAIRSLWPA